MSVCSGSTAIPRRCGAPPTGSDPLPTACGWRTPTFSTSPRSRAPTGWPRRLHVATKPFQAVRMAVNDETGALRQTLPRAAALLESGARLGVISFHSGEDRIVKRTFRSMPADYAELEPSPLTPGVDEVRANPRARSAKLRVLERLQ